ncbi:hypothetical protein CH298_02430 [Rhodococcoides fascians]|uniref:hypothetical protein n=1 Tax=Rhodococcoides fascians TaxID=1828 RepID=UPI000B9BA535|nr:hypothetical protein [Rhodococcus fascians]OZE92416.1 hypothetical protein CH303_02430 [Rhodococcus fascians]OZF23049.1 hypothetical protein CH298_02430 [Rhodococcus fascians]OZF24763.1 hypothetical protein CH297_02430 [Rhodococcus fascians]OZF73012.1 hypothetical protein CH308_02435 [Rhodococcus fascians]OZF74177.1 hypothetical protein CH307_02430 [Rhodococcus fascians]
MTHDFETGNTTAATAVLTDEDRQLFADVAIILVPGDGDMPSANEVDISHRWLDLALQTRPDMLPVLTYILGELRARDTLQLPAAIDDVAESSQQQFETFGKLVSGAYFLDPRVRAAIGYPGQEARPLVDDTEQYLDLLVNVAERGPIYRATP